MCSGRGSGPRGLLGGDIQRPDRGVGYHGAGIFQNSSDGTLKTDAFIMC